MKDNNISPDLLEPSLPGAWIVEHNQIGQIPLLEAKELARFCDSRGLSDFGEEGIIHLWQLGLLKADLIESDEEVSYNGLIARGNDRYGRYIYSDERQLQQRVDGWADAEKTITPLSNTINLYFHPFRYYVLYHINRILSGANISKMQMFNQSSYPKLLEWKLSFFNSWAISDQFIPSIKRWNDIASLCILTEPCMYQHIFHSIQYDPTDMQNYENGAEEIKKHIGTYWHRNVEKLYLKIGLDHLEQIRRDLCFDTQMLDPNRWIHTLVCLGKSELRLKLEGHLGGALFLRTMAEMLRRATEEAFDTTLREEDELGAGWVPENSKKDLYGSNRLLDDAQAGSVFVRRYGLNYKPRVHWYGEGETECGALNSFFKMIGISVPVTNLHGLIKEGKSMVTFFRDSLRSDIRDEMYSIVLIDGDVRPNVKIMESAARNNQISEDDGIFGRFFLSQPDFEFGNFEVEELEDILWKLAGEEQPNQKDRDQLHSYVKIATKSAEFFKGVERASQENSQLIHLDKGEAWGEELIKFAWEHPFKQNQKR